MVLAKSRQAGSCAVEACAPGCAPQSHTVYPARRRAARRSTPAAPGARQPPAACMRSFSRPRVEPLLDRSRRNSLDALSYGRRTPRTCCAAAARPLGPLPAPRRRCLHTALGLSVAPCRRQSLESPAAAMAKIAVRLAAALCLVAAAQAVLNTDRCALVARQAPQMQPTELRPVQCPCRGDHSKCRLQLGTASVSAASYRLSLAPAAVAGLAAGPCSGATRRGARAHVAAEAVAAKRRAPLTAPRPPGRCPPRARSASTSTTRW